MSPFIRFALLSTLVAGCFGDSTSDRSSAATGSGGGGGGNVRGAIFTTTVDGSSVNANIYDAKGDVYLDGGPGNNAPSGAAALPAGDYYFQVTDPSGKRVLSQDDVSCRKIHVNGDGVIDTAYPGAGCQHATGIDSDHAALGAITVQLMPYADTPNNGGVYKVWVTPVGDLAANGDFKHNQSKTDNFKVRSPNDQYPHCGDSHVDTGEECDDGNINDGDGCSSTCQNETPPPPPSCANGVLEAGEQCDDGNTAAGDGCSATCQTEMMPPPPTPCCGDGHLDSGEACDDGNTSSGDGCSAMCTIETPPPPPACCGNGFVESGEGCDDGNNTSGDGCSAECTIEPPPPPPPVCGNGMMEGNEGCDDGNLESGDGCSANCEMEPCDAMAHMMSMD